MIPFVWRCCLLTGSGAGFDLGLAVLWWRSCGLGLALGGAAELARWPALWSAISAVVAVATKGLGLLVDLSTQHVLLLWKILGGLRNGGVK